VALLLDVDVDPRVGCDGGGSCSDTDGSVELAFGAVVATGVPGVGVEEDDVGRGCSSVVASWTAPPELPMTTVGEPADPIVVVRFVEPVSATVVAEVLGVDGGAVEPVAPLESTAAVSVVVTVPSVWVGVASVAAEVVSDCESDCVVANATPGTATAVPIPNRIARAPVRPMYLAYRVLTAFIGGAGMWARCAACFGPTDSFAALLSCFITGLLTRIDLSRDAQLQGNAGRY
jgi:hypothetical protein